ncbi:PASTA domain-containing protein [Amycolatopsis sp. CA-230715]|uniref:PASTA domain-containing protein n=1 Tax=Amycolatopsis sp. CA-230715 TaxID=2745196 RepID=UPI001C33D6A4|nr:PASTA domain-containing protein [Amycolatopsis sp. CA-230715]QWF79278.1 hypothetical protein HUW46_02685 [Amycolatopsis sp. CA-230715]
MPERKPTTGAYIAVGAVVVLGIIGTLAGKSEKPAPSTSTTSPTYSASPLTTSQPAAVNTQAKSATVPDVSGMDHQSAQDTMQAAGFYNLREVDGTGKGRMLLVDRNWVQTGQSPAAGTVAPTDTVITLTAIKYTDR